jgi:hypothetical protein
VQSEANPLELEAMRKRAWQQQGVVVLQPEEVVDPWLRQALFTEAERRYGRRRGSGQ